jgi:hypothetical protein
MLEKFIIKKDFQFPMPPDGTGLEVKATPEGAEPSELELTPEKRQELIDDGFIVPLDEAQA